MVTARPSASLAHLASTCHCGRIASAPCPTLADMPTAHAAIEARGWRWYDGIGHMCSPACAWERANDLAARQGRASAWPRRDAAGDLFERAEAA